MRARLLVAAVFCCFAQEPPLRVTTTLVQIDAVVTGRGGRPVTDLTRDDFALFEDGKRREIRSFSFVRTGAAIQATPPGRTAAPAATHRLKREDVRRTMALLVDDIKMSFESAHYTREALKKFIDAQIAPGDLVAIMTTSGSTGALQQFTTDRRQMRAAVDRIRVGLTGGGPASAVPAIGGGEGDDAILARMLQRRFAVGTLGAIRHIAEGMREMPGRKSVVLFSEGMKMARDFSKEEPPVDVNDVRRVSDSANRSAVVIYAVDPRGVVYPGLQAKDNVQDLEQSEVRDAIGARLEKLRGTQATMQFLASETGGIAAINNNDMNGSLQQILDDQAGYYLLGFQPGEEDVERLKKEGKYHRLEVKVKRPGLQVRYRKGYLREPEASVSEARTPAERLLAALTTPFANSGIPLRFTPVFALGEKRQYMMRALVHIAGGDVTFGPANGEGIRTATLHLAVVTDGETAKERTTTQKSYTIRVAQEALAHASQGGFVYTLEHTIPKPGAYQMRVALLDAESGRTGSASRFVEVPDLSRGALAISGITMADGDWRPGSHAAEAPAENDVSPAARVFTRGRMFSYGVTVYNARLDERTRQPAVELQARLIRGDAVVWEGKRFSVALPAGADPRSIPAGGVLTLGEKTAPGEYMLELQAIERGGTRVAASQWIDFALE